MYFWLFILKVSPFVLPSLIIGVVIIIFYGIRSCYYFSKFHSYIMNHYPNIAGEILEKNPVKTSRKYFKSLYYEGFPEDDSELQALVARTKKATEQMKYIVILFMVLFFVIIIVGY